MKNALTLKLSKLHQNKFDVCKNTHGFTENDSDHLFFCLSADGPLSVKILTQDAIVFGIPVSLKCYADSRPECDFHWFVNNHSLSEITGSEITFTPLKDSNWSYTCKAMNPVTNITMYKTKTFTIGE